MLKPDLSCLDGTEKLIYSLRGLYGEYGYRRYKMSKFEEYALYGRNIDFLVSDSVITFTDTDGKLMALKPDVTLSIVKNDRDGADGVRKVCYNESVYRVSKGTGTFREIMQAGLECIGKVDPALVAETLTLAAKSLELTGRKYVVEVSHLGLIMSAIDSVTDDASLKNELLALAGEKNVHGIERVCGATGIGAEKYSALTGMIATYGEARSVIKALGTLGLSADGARALSELEEVIGLLPDGVQVTVDLSVTADVNYYNGIVFKGFVEGAPGGVLSGGQYDRLMKKMGRRSRAVGFAVYLDMLERLL